MSTLIKYLAEIAELNTSKKEIEENTSCKRGSEFNPCYEYNFIHPDVQLEVVKRFYDDFPKVNGENLHNCEFPIETKKQFINYVYELLTNPEMW